MRAHQIMSRQVVSIRPEAPITDAIKVMLAHHISGLPVVDSADNLVGIICESDFLRRSEIGTEHERNRSPRVTSNSSGCGQSNSSTREAGQGTVSLSLFPGQ
ncbi:CBS domain-containing protein, partial [Bradyrhizobium diazoefficiens]|uniref:CBS domain-containing protein n=2 Tax=Bradyrhizobium diazoefficiens TaxID=1355477 RepID=UPI002010E19F